MYQQAAYDAVTLEHGWIVTLESLLTLSYLEHLSNVTLEIFLKQMYASTLTHL